jgi:hypothetical protein
VAVNGDTGEKQRSDTPSTKPYVVYVVSEGKC